MNNRQHLSLVSDPELVRWMKQIHKTPGFEYVDWSLWLRSTTSQIPYLGWEGLADDRPCIVLEELEDEEENKLFAIILQDGAVWRVPIHNVTYNSYEEKKILYANQ